MSLLCCSILIPVNAAGIGDEINNLGNLNLSELFQRYASGTDGALTEGIIYHMGEYFFEDPVAFIRTLAQESNEVQEKIIERAPFPVSMYHDMYPGGHAKFPEAVASIALTEEDSENAHHILQCFRDAVALYWGSEDIDFSTVDFSTIVWTPDVVSALGKWFEKQDLQTLFSFYYKRPNMDYSWIKIVSGRLLEDPVTFMRTLSREDTQLQTAIIQRLTSSIYTGIAPGREELPAVIAATKLDETDTEATKQVLAWFREEIEKAGNDWNPKTGDPAGVAAALLAASGAGLAILPKLRKKEE